MGMRGCKVLRLRKLTGLPVVWARAESGHGHVILLYLEDGRTARLFKDGTIERSSYDRWKDKGERRIRYHGERRLNELLPTKRVRL